MGRPLKLIAVFPITTNVVVTHHLDHNQLHWSLPARTHPVEASVPYCQEDSYGFPQLPLQVAKMII